MSKYRRIRQLQNGEVGARIKELERLYGIHRGGHGSNQYVQNANNSVSAKSQEYIAEQMGISIQTLQNYKKLTEMIPELEDLVDTGIVTKTSPTKNVGLVSSYILTFDEKRRAIRENNRRRKSSGVLMCCQTGNF